MGAGTFLIQNKGARSFLSKNGGNGGGMFRVFYLFPFVAYDIDINGTFISLFEKTFTFHIQASNQRKQTK